MAHLDDDENPQEPAEVRAGANRHGHGAKSAAVRERAVIALLSENSIGAAAERCGLDEKTLRRWMANDDAFKAQLESARRSMFEAATNRLLSLAGQAVSTLAGLMSEKTPPNVRLGAARTIAELGINRADAEAIVQKLHEIEAFQRRNDAEKR